LENSRRSRSFHRSRRKALPTGIRRFIGVFARPEHPLALFLDDLQWLDAATLDLLEDLLTRSDLQHLMLIGAYRDNEVDATHPLAGKLEVVKNAGAQIEEITLAPLASEHLAQLIADALRSNRSALRRSRNWCMRRRVATPFSPFSSFLRSPKRACSPSIMMLRDGPGISIAFTPRVTPIMWWTSWSGS